MAEIVEVGEEQESKKFSLENYLDIVRRRHMYFLIPLLAGWLLVWGASWILPAQYKSGTLILVEQPTMPKNYVEPNVSEDIQNRLQSITQQILSRTRLLLIIDKLHLYDNARGNITPDTKVEKMRKDIEVELVRDTQNKEITAFRIYYTAHDPHVAQQVTNELTNLFINENLQSRQQESEGTTKFLQSQLNNASETLAEQEAQIRDFQGKHEGELPTQQASNLQILAGLQTQLQSEQDSLNSANQQKVYLQSLIEQYRNMHEAAKAGEGGQNSITEIDQEIGKLKAQRVNLTARYTEKHPDVQNLDTEIAKKEKQRAELVAAVKNGSRNSKSAANTGAVATAQNATFLQLQSQLRANEAEIANRADAINKLKARVGMYQSRLDNQPVREQQLADLTRGYDQSKANYDALLKKKNDSEMATSMEQLQQGQRFRMIDPPSLPTKPSFPNRIKLCALGIMAGILLGIAVVVVGEFFDDRIQNEEVLKAMLPVQVIAEIPQIVNAEQENVQQKKILIGWSTTGVVFAAIFVGSLVSYFHQ
jgi:polysaccharide biosynthesis transport protein